LLFSKRKRSETIAAVDLGSNSFHMKVANIKNGELVVVDRMREMVRLAEGLDDAKYLRLDVQQRAIDCLKRFGERLEELPQGSVRAVGTNTLRSAHNAQEFLSHAEEVLGHSIETISGVEEARLIYHGVAHSIAIDQRQRLVVDIGGGSTEIIIGKEFTPEYMESLYMGCVNMSNRFFPDGAITDKQYKKAKLAAQQELEPIIDQCNRLKWECAIGASGTIRAIMKTVTVNSWSTNDITPSALNHLMDTILEAGHIDNMKIKGLDPARIPVFAGGVVILMAIFDVLGIDHMQVSDGALREGLLYDLLGRIQHKDIRKRSVSGLAARFHVDEAQVRRVEQTAVECLRQVAGSWDIDAESGAEWLGWAAQLHEIGLDIAHSQYHKHGAYVIEYADLLGYSRQEQKFIAILVRSHRRKFPVKEFKGLPADEARTLQHLAIIFRLAVVLHRNRSDEKVPALGLEAGNKRLAVDFPAGWLAGHSLTQADLEQEASYLKALDFKLEYRETD
jgi:exopolyphosphatase/guanosine-5'-triphosphate,3'-diphosphate pyrophosphatase